MHSSWSDPEIESALIAVLRPAPAPIGAIDRMLARLPARVPAAPLWRQRRVRFAAALAAAAIALILGATPQARDAVANTVRQLFYFVPGQGIRSAPATSLVLDHPVVVSREGITVRVVRWSSRTPRRSSSCWITWVAVDRGTSRSCAAWVKLRRSTTRVNSRIASSRSMALLLF